MSELLGVYLEHECVGSADNITVEITVEVTDGCVCVFKENVSYDCQYIVSDLFVWEYVNRLDYIIP